MALSAFGKARLAALGFVHSLLDQVVNTPPAYAQRIRDLENALAGLYAAVDESRGTIVGHQREIAQLQDRIRQDNANANFLASDANKANDVEIPQLEVRIEDANTRIAKLQAMIDEATAENNDITEDIAVIEARKRELLDGYHDMLDNLARAKAREGVAETLAQAKDMFDATVDASIDSPVKAAEHRNDVAREKLNRAMQGMRAGRSAEDAAKLSRAEQAAAERIARLNNNAAAEMTANPA